MSPSTCGCQKGVLGPLVVVSWVVCEPPDLRAGNQTLVLYKSSKCSEPLKPGLQLLFGF